MEKKDLRMMNSKVVFSGLAVLVVVAAVFVLIGETGSQKSEVRDRQTAPATPHLPPATQALADPEAFQVQEEAVRKAPVPLRVPTERPKQLSEVERQETGARRQGTGDRRQGTGGRRQGSGVGDQGSEREPVKAESLYFWDSYKSLRKEEIRNPDSKENREGAVELLKARQRRAGISNSEQGTAE